MSSSRKRTQARELAIQCLYQLDTAGKYDEETVDSTSNWSTIPDDAKDFARDLVQACWQQRAELDDHIRKVAEHWDIDRMAVLDRNILRLAIHELFHRDDIPPKVSINEAIELGKRFSTKGSGAFINGILDRLRKDHPEIARKGEALDATAPDEVEAADDSEEAAGDGDSAIEARSPSTDTSESTAPKTPPPITRFPRPGERTEP